MLDTIREYGAMWRYSLGEDAELRTRHARYFVELVREAERDWLGPGQRAAYRRTAAAHGDLCAALAHGLAHAPGQALELAGRIGFFWACCGHLHVARGYLERALSAAEAHNDPHTVDTGPDDRPRALWALGVTLLLQGEHERAHRLAVTCESLAGAERSGAERSAPPGPGPRRTPRTCSA